MADTTVEKWAASALKKAAYWAASRVPRKADLRVVALARPMVEYSVTMRAAQTVAESVWPTAVYSAAKTVAY